MAGVMWRRSVILLMFCGWQACSAEQLVNLVEPQLTKYAPSYMRFGAVNLFDHDKSTYQTGGGTKIWLSPPIRPTKFRITMAAHVPPEEYPRRVRVGGTLVRGIVFENGVYEGTLESVHDLSKVRIDIPDTWKRFDIAEIELLGPREALDALWYHGKYPCSERLAIITTDKGLKKVFSKSKNPLSEDDLRRAFSPDKDPHTGRVTFYYHGARPAIIGAVIPDGLPLVHQVSVNVRRRKGLKELVLEGHKCHPRSKTGECKGWERLASLETWDSYKPYRYRLQVESPGKYKAYRVKFIPRKQEPGWPNGKYISVGGIYFQGCTA